MTHMLEQAWISGATNIGERHEGSVLRLILENWDGHSPVLWGDQNLLVIIDPGEGAVHRLTRMHGHYYHNNILDIQTAYELHSLLVTRINYLRRPRHVTADQWHRLMQLAQDCHKSRIFLMHHKP